MLFQGQSCEECGLKIHAHCASRFFQQNNNPHCPDEDCRAPWPHELLHARGDFV